MGKHKGFTLIEIVLFLAVTAALFIGIAGGMQNAISRQRYDDVVQNFAEFLRSIYSEVSNPQSAGKGNSTQYAIYGKLIVFGEGYDINGAKITDSGVNPVFIYDVVGKPAGSQDIGSGSASQLLYNLEANVVRQVSSSKVALVYPEKYEPRWQMEILNTSNNRFTGSILVVRHPRSGTINTLVSSATIPVNQEVASANNANNGVNGTKRLLMRYFNVDNNSDRSRYAGKLFEVKEVDFCVSPYKPGETGMIPQQNIRLLSNARNASSVEMIDTDGGDNRCKK